MLNNTFSAKQDAVPFSLESLLWGGGGQNFQEIFRIPFSSKVLQLYTSLKLFKTKKKKKQPSQQSKFRNAVEKEMRLQSTKKRIQKAQEKENGMVLQKKYAMAESVLIFAALETSNLMIFLQRSKCLRCDAVSLGKCFPAFTRTQHHIPRNCNPQSHH